MARMVNLGQVGFGLVANTDELKDSLELLKVFGREVDRISHLTSTANQEAHAWGVTLEGTLTRMQAAAQRAVRDLQAMGASQESINKVSTDSNKVIKEMINNSGELEEQKNRVMRAQIGQQEIINTVMQAERAAAAQRKQIDRDHQTAMLEDQRRTQEDYATRGKFVQQYETERRRQMAQTQQMINQNEAMTRQVNERVARAQTLGVSAGPIASTQAALGAFTSADPAQRATSLNTLRNAISNLNVEITKSAGVTNTFSLALRDLERATILAVGPLSGIGARLAVLSALFESTSFAAAAAIGVVVGVGAAITLMSAATIRATMDMQRFDAMLGLATGSAALAGDEYQKVLAISNKWGLSIRETAEPYAKFITAARLSGLALDDQARAFEGVTVASRATHLNAERTSLVFLALEQMLSKGTVYMEEMRRQLGDLLPGAFQVAAKAMGMTQAEFTKAITDGRILATDLLPKLSDALLEVFGPAAERASHNLQGEFGRFHTSLFELARAFEATTGITATFTKMVVAATDGIKFLSLYMREAIGTIGALAGAGATLLLISNFGLITAGARAAGAAIAEMTLYLRAFKLEALTLLIPGLGTIAGLLTRIGAVAVGAAVGYELMVPSMENVNRAMDDFITKGQESIDIWKKIGEADKQAADQQAAATATRLRETNAKLMDASAKLTLEIKRRADEINDMMSVGPGGDKAKAALQANMQSIIDNDPRIVYMRGVQKELSNQSLQLQSQLEQMMDIKKVGPANEPVPGHAFENWIKSIEKDIRAISFLGQELAAGMQGQEAIDKLKAMRESLDQIARMPDKDRGNIAGLMNQLRDLGYTFSGVGRDAEFGAAQGIEALTQQLQKANFDKIIGERALKDIENYPKKVDAAAKSVQRMFDELDARREAALGFNAQDMTSERRINEQTLRMREQLDVMGKINLSQAQINALRKLGMDDKMYEYLQSMGLTQEELNKRLKTYKELLTDTAHLEKTATETAKLDRAVEALENRMGTRADRVIEKYRDDIVLLNEAFQAGRIGFDRYMQDLDMIQGQTYKTLLSSTTKFGADLHSLMNSMERDISKSLVDPLFGVKDSWQNLFRSLERMILEFIAKVTLVQPMMTTLFGTSYSGYASSGMGIIPRMFPGFFPGMPERPTGGPGDTTGMAITPDSYWSTVGSQSASQAAWIDAMNATGFASGGSFDVGGSGGTDSQLVQFKATPGEHVSVGQQAMDVHINVNNQTGVPVQADQSSARIDSGKLVVDLMLSHLTRDSGSREQMNRLMTGPQH